MPSKASVFKQFLALVSISVISREKSSAKMDHVPKQLTTQLLNLSSANISQELKQSCSNIVALTSFKSTSSEKDYLLRRLKELIDLEEKQVKLEIKKKKELLKNKRKKQNKDLKELTERQLQEINQKSQKYEREIADIQKTFIEKSEFFKNELQILEKELNSISAPTDLLSSLMTQSAPSSLSVTSPTTLIDDMSDELECCSCHIVCYPPAHIFQCNEGLFDIKTISI